MPDISYGLMYLLGPVGYAKFLEPIALLILGLGAWSFFRQLRLTPLAALLGALAATLNSTFFSGACWGVASQEIAIGLIFFALALVVSISSTTPRWVRWGRVAVAGMLVGLNIFEASDIGALLSLFVAAFVVYQAAVSAEGNPFRGMALGVGRVTAIALCAAFVAAYALTTLISTQIEGIAGTQQNAKTKAARWDFATQWSLPKRETLGLVVPGLFGYRMDTPNGGQYWGAIGRNPAWDQYFANGEQGSPPQGVIRFSGGGNYMGVLVVLVALWAAFQTFRQKHSVFTPDQRKLLWFWVGLAVVSLLLAWGRFAPFYRLLYALPYFSTIRNPTKFLDFVSIAVVVLFAYGIHGLDRRYLQTAPTVRGGRGAGGKWAGLDAFDRRWIVGCVAAIGVSLVAWLIYADSRQALETYLEHVQFGSKVAQSISGFSIWQVGWFILFLVASVVVMTLILRGVWAGKRSKWAGIFLGLVLVADLGRANEPWIVYWNYHKKYETYGPNQIIQFLENKTYDHRVAILPQRVLAAFRLPQQAAQMEERLSGLYGIEWNQQLFPYYNIQTLDVIQMPRMATDLENYEMALAPYSAATLRNVGRKWELTNTRYLLGYVGFLGLLNSQFNPGRGEFRIAKRFNIVPKPGVTEPKVWADMTAEPSTNGAYALFDFTGALPRAKLYSRWEVPGSDKAALKKLRGESLNGQDQVLLNQAGTNGFLTLKTLASPDFDPAKTVLLASPLAAAQPTNSVAGSSGTVEITHYAPKDVQLKAQAKTASVLLLNDKYNPYWQVWVDGKRGQLLRCNYIMRGVYLPAGTHTIEFRFRPPIASLYVSLAALACGLGLLGCLAVSSKREPPNDPEVSEKSRKNARTQPQTAKRAS